MKFTEAETMGAGSFALALLLAVLVAFVAVWDAIALYWGGPAETVSAVVVGWSAQSPLLPLFAGIVIGHLFFPGRHP